MPIYTSLISAGIVAFVISTAVSPIGAYIYRWMKDKINPSHTSETSTIEDTPRLGGIGVVLGFWITVGVILALRTELIDQKFIGGNQVSFVYWLAGLSVGGYLLSVLRDIFTLHIGYKIGIQIVLSVGSAIILFPIQKLTLPFIGPLLVGDFGILIMSIWIFSLINIITIIDGLDTYSSGSVVMVTAGTSIVAYFHGNMLFLTIGLVLFAATTGFLVFNRPPRVKQGEGGSLFLGYLIAVIPFLQIKTSTGEWTFFPIILFGVPVLDGVLTVLRRLVLDHQAYTTGSLLSSGLKSVFKRLNYAQSIIILHAFTALYLCLFVIGAIHPPFRQSVFIIFLSFEMILLAFGIFVFFSSFTGKLNEDSGEMEIKATKNPRLSEKLDDFLRLATTLDEGLFVAILWLRQFNVSELKLTLRGEVLERRLMEKTDLKERTEKRLFQTDEIELEIEVTHNTQSQSESELNQIAETILRFLESHPS